MGRSIKIEPMSAMHKRFLRVFLPVQNRLSQIARTDRNVVSGRRKSRIYNLTRRVMAQSGIGGALAEHGINSYVLHVVSGMAPNRLAIGEHSDLDLALTVRPDRGGEIGTTYSAVTHLRGITRRTKDPISWVVQFEVPGNLYRLGVQDTMDIFINSMCSESDGVRLLYDYYTVTRGNLSGILMARHFSLDKEISTLERFLIERSRHKSEQEVLAEVMLQWDDALSVDLYHLKHHSKLGIDKVLKYVGDEKLRRRLHHRLNVEEAFRNGNPLRSLGILP